VKCGTRADVSMSVRGGRTNCPSDGRFPKFDAESQTARLRDMTRLGAFLYCKHAPEVGQMQILSVHCLLDFQLRVSF